MRYASCKLKDAIGLFRKVIPELVAGIIILITILLLAACNDESSNNTSPTFTMSSIAGLSFFGSLDQPFSADFYDYSVLVGFADSMVQVTATTEAAFASVSINNSDAVLAIGAVDEGSNTTGVNGNQIDNSAANAGTAYVFQ
jgi:hypothetical protein